MVPIDEYDLLVIGTGSGLDVAAAGAHMGLDVAIVEKGAIGGTCLLRGCIPSKLLIHRADLLRDIQDADRFGIHATVDSVDYADMVTEVTNHVTGESDDIERGIKRSPNHTLYQAAARFVSERTVEVNDREVRGEKVVVAAGTRPHVPDIDGLDDLNYLTSREALRLTDCPDSMLIIGGGYVGAELAHFFGTMGTETTVFGRSGLLPNEDHDIRKKFTDAFTRDHRLIEAEVTAIRRENDTATVTTASGETHEIAAKQILVATGRVPNTDILAVENAGIETDSKGFIAVNEYLETTAENVWALGDIIGDPMYKHTANEEARFVTLNALADHQHPIDYRVNPHAIFSRPQVAAVGKTQDQLEKEGTPHAVGHYPYRHTGMGLAMKEKDGFVKALVHPDTGKILGCHILGPDAPTLIHEVVIAMKAGDGTVHNIHDSIHVHPALSEVVQRAFDSLEMPGKG